LHAAAAEADILFSVYRSKAVTERNVGTASHSAQ